MAARECHDDGVGAGGVPGADAVGLLDRGHPAAGHAAGVRRSAVVDVVAASRRPAAGAGRRRAAALPQPDLQHRGGDSPRCGAGRGAEVLSADLPRVLRAPPDRPRRRRARRDPSSGATTFRSARPAVRRRRPTRASCCTSRSARTCGCRYHRARRRRWPGATVLANLSGSPITIGRADDRKLLARSASARCLAAYVYAAAGEGESTHRPGLGRSDDDLRERRAAGRIRALSQGRAAQCRRRRHRAAACRAAADRARSTTTADTTELRTDAFRRVGFVTLDPPDGDIGLRRERRAVPVRARRIPHGCNRIATRPTTSRCPVWNSGCAR